MGIIIIIGVITAIILAVVLTKNGKTTLWAETIVLTTGAVKSGKSLNTIAGAIKEHRKRHILWKIKKYFGIKEEEPLLYSNIPLKYPHVKLTEKHMLRETRFNYKPVVLLDEFALIADSMEWRDKEKNEKLLKFFKLFGHETKGGKLFINTQSIEDCHYAVKRCISRYYYIAKTIKWIPFIVIQKYVICGYNELQQGSDTQNGITASEKHYTKIIGKWYYKKYDRYCYSILTDELYEKPKVIQRAKSLKTSDILTIKGEKKNDNKETK